MLTIACVLHALAVASWYAAAVGGPLWLRWVVLALALPVLVLARFASGRRVRASATLLPLACLVGYGLVLAVASASQALALLKAGTFGATAIVGLLGGAAWVERVGRDGVLRAWRWAWRAYLAYAIVAYASGSWRQGPEGLYGPTGNPNMFGSILATLGIVVFVPGERDRTEWMVVEGVALALLLLATRARTSLAAALAAAIVALALGSSPRRRAWVVLLLVLLGGVLLAFPDRSVGAFADVAEGTSVRGILRTRTETWRSSWDAMVDGLPFGFGWGVKKGAPSWTFDVKTIGFGREEGTSWLPVGEELGLPGFVLVAWLWGRIGARAFSLPKRAGRLAAASIVLYFVIATFEGWFLSPGNWESMAFWTTLGIAFAVPRAGPVRLASPPPDASAVPEPAITLA